MMSMSEAVKRVQGLAELGKLDCGQNVAVIRLMGVRLIIGRMPQGARRELSAAVKGGLLGHLPKKGLEPEAYFHPNSKWNAMEIREKHASESIAAIRKVCT